MPLCCIRTSLGAPETSSISGSVANSLHTATLEQVVHGKGGVGKVKKLSVKAGFSSGVIGFLPGRPFTFFISCFVAHVAETSLSYVKALIIIYIKDIKCNIFVNLIIPLPNLLAPQRQKGSATVRSLLPV